MAADRRYVNTLTTTRERGSLRSVPDAKRRTVPEVTDSFAMHQAPVHHA
jgi:hypothetical protein